MGALGALGVINYVCQIHLLQSYRHLLEHQLQGNRTGGHMVPFICSGAEPNLRISVQWKWPNATLTRERTFPFDLS